MHTRDDMKPKRSTSARLRLKDGLDGGNMSFKAADLTQVTQTNSLHVMLNCELYVLRHPSVEA